MWNSSPKASASMTCDWTADPKYAHLDFEDCTLMGYKDFGSELEQ